MKTNEGYRELPTVLLDEEGYPTKKRFNLIENYKPDENFPLIDFIEKYLSKGWWHPARGFRLHRKYKGKWYNSEEGNCPIEIRIYENKISNDFNSI